MEWVWETWMIDQKLGAETDERRFPDKRRSYGYSSRDLFIPSQRIVCLREQLFISSTINVGYFVSERIQHVVSYIIRHVPWKYSILMSNVRFHIVSDCKINFVLPHGQSSYFGTAYLNDCGMVEQIKEPVRQTSATPHSERAPSGRGDQSEFPRSWNSCTDAIGGRDAHLLDNNVAPGPWNAALFYQYESQSEQSQSTG